MKKSNFYMIGILVLVVIGFFLISGGKEVNGGNSGVDNKEVQVVKMHVEGSKYVLEPNTVKKDIPVRLEADMARMPGCSRSFIMSDFNVRKNFGSNSNYVEFTPDKTGSFYIACSMNMYTGRLVVE